MINRKPLTRKISIEKLDSRNEIEYLIDVDSKIEVTTGVIVVKRSLYNDEIIFMYALQPGDCYSVSDIDENEKFLDDLSFLSPDDLDKVKNFCKTSQLIN